MIGLAAALALVAYLPGALIFRLPLADRDRRMSLEPEERVYWAVMLSLAISLTAGFVLAAAGRFSLLRVIAVDGLIAVLAIAAANRRLLARGATLPTAWTVAPVLVAALCVWLYPPPSEYVMGGKDPGTYLNAGIQIAHDGSLITHDEVIATLPREYLPLFFPPHGYDEYYSLRFMGFFLLDPATGAVVDQFPHLYPVAVALGYELYGLTGARSVSIALAVLGVLGLYFLAARLAGRPAALAASGLLAIHLVQIWHARIPNSEILTQPLLLAGMLACTRAHVDGDRFFAPAAGLLLGLLLFSRIDGVLVLAFAGAGLGLWWLTGWRVRAAFVIPLAALGAAAGPYAAAYLAPYLNTPRRWLAANWIPLAAVMLAAGAAGAAGLRLRRHEPVRRAVRTWAPAAIAAGIVGLAIYAWFFRFQGGRLAEHDASSLRMFGWYVHPLAIAIAVAGFVLLATRRFWKDPVFLSAAAGSAVFFFYKIRIVPEHFWTTRRFVPILLPAVMLCLAAALVMPLDLRGARARLAGWIRYGVGAAVLAAIAASFWQAAAPVRAHVEYAGLIPRLEALANRLTDRDLLLVESRNATDVHVLALPLAYIYDREVLVLTSPRPDRLRFAGFIRWALEHYENVYFLAGGGTDLLSRSFEVHAVASESIQIPEYESAWNAYPSGVRLKKFHLDLYRFAPARKGVVPPTSVDVGAADDLHVLRFHAKERDRRGTYRWSRDVSYLMLSGIDANATALVLWLDGGGRPRSAPPADVEVSIGETVIGRVRVEGGRAAYTLPIPPDLAEAAGRAMDPLTVRLRTTTWNPRELLGVPDDRDLGVMVDRVEVVRR